MGSHKEVPETAQLSLIPEADPSDTLKQDPPSPDRFIRGNPERLYIGEVRLDKYLKDAGKGFVIHFRERLFEQDATDFFCKYKSRGRKPYHPFVILGLILYGAQMGRWSLRELEDLARTQSARSIARLYSKQLKNGMRTARAKAAPNIRPRFVLTSRLSLPKSIV